MNLFINIRRPQIQLVLVLSIIQSLRSSTIVIARSTTHKSAIITHISSTNRLTQIWTSPVLGFLIFVPCDMSAISSITTKSVVLLVKSKAIDLENICFIFNTRIVIWVFVFNPMTFETKIISLASILSSKIHVND